MPPEVVRRIVEAGRLSGSGMNSQPWHFIVARMTATDTPLASIARTGRYIAQAPLAILVVAIEKTKLAPGGCRARIQSDDAHRVGGRIGSNWVGFTGLDDVKPLLGIPNDLEVLGIIPFGYPVQPGGKGKKFGNRCRRSLIAGASANPLRRVIRGRLPKSAKLRLQI